ncbi:MAG: hypothetical protein AAGH68_09660 [Pseudomonadota bacterium]
MALSVAQLQGLRDALETARYRGVPEVEYDGERIAYKSENDMRQALADLDRQIAALTSERRATDIRFTYSKGL